jgi:hypothetical protein
MLRFVLRSEDGDLFISKTGKVSTKVVSFGKGSSWKSLIDIQKFQEIFLNFSIQEVEIDSDENDCVILPDDLF